MAMVCDGAQTNRNVWKQFGIIGTVEKTVPCFDHPTEDNRKIYAFSDVPHLFKCIRNNLYARHKFTVQILKIT